MKNYLLLEVRALGTDARKKGTQEHSRSQFGRQRTTTHYAMRRVRAGTAVGCRSGDAHTDAMEKETQTDNGSAAAQLGATQLTQSDAAM